MASSNAIWEPTQEDPSTAASANVPAVLGQSQPSLSDVSAVARMGRARPIPNLPLFVLTQEGAASDVGPSPVENRREAGPSKGGNKETPAVVVPIPPLPKPAVPVRSQVLNLWEGSVIDMVGETEFVARLRDTYSDDQSWQRATFSLQDVSDSDLSLVAPGAVFYWSIGYRIEPYGQKNLTSSLRFRRLPAWTSGEIARADEMATEYDIFFEEPGKPGNPPRSE